MLDTLKKLVETATNDELDNVFDELSILSAEMEEKNKNSVDWQIIEEFRQILEELNIKKNKK